MHSTHLEHANFSECYFLHHLVFFSFQKLFDGYKLTCFLCRRNKSRGLHLHVGAKALTDSDAVSVM